MNLYKLFKSVTLIDQTVSLENQLQFDKDLSKGIDVSSFIVRLWSTQGVILGKVDALLPDFEKGLKVLNKANVKTLIRKAGGLAVVCDDGILNLSILYSKNHPLIGGLNESYEFGVDLIKHLLHELHLSIESGEIVNSYCPGKYDLSVNGKKIAGMAQYRSKETVMLMVTVCVSGQQKDRCELIQHFYAAANPLKDPKYPEVDPLSMTTLSELKNRIITVDALKQNIFEVLIKSGIPSNVKKQM